MICGQNQAVRIPYLKPFCSIQVTQPEDMTDFIALSSHMESVIIVAC